MQDWELAGEIAKGIINTGVESWYGGISCSTAGDYPSMGVSQWEGSRGDYLLSCLDGGKRFIGRTYSDIKDSGDLKALETVLCSPQGQAAQHMILQKDCLELYVPALKQVPYLDDSRCFIYAGIWCPTNHDVVRRFLQNRYKQYNIRSLDTLRAMFREQYYIAASVGIACADGYANRAENTYQYVAGINLSAYGVPAYGQGPFGR